jgi:GT2 family glycosyltransferase
VFLDADETVEETFVGDVLQQFRGSNIDYLGFNVKMYIPEGEVTLWAEYDAAMGLPVEHYLQTKKFAPTCALAVRRKVFDEVGTFTETLISGGDKEFGQRVHKAGFSMGFASDITIKHPARTQFHAIKKKAKRIGRGKAQILLMSDPESIPISLTYFLPPNPIRVKNRSRNPDCFVVIYLVEYLIKILQLYGIVYEYMTNRDRYY